MTFNVTEIASQNVLEVEVNGKLTKEAYAEFVPLTEKLIEQYGKVRLLVLLHDFHGWDAGALWEDLKFDFKHFNDIERLAIVGDKTWEKGMAYFCKVFTLAKVRYFDISERDEAEAWPREAE